MSFIRKAVKSIAYKIPLVKHLLEVYHCVKDLEKMMKKSVAFNAAVKRFLISNFPMSIGEHKMFLDYRDTIIGSTLFYDGIWESSETELIKKEIKAGDSVLDIGANIGYYTLLFAKLVTERGRVFAFEPSPNNFVLLEKNIKINGYKNVIPIQKAVSNKTAKGNLYLSEDNYGDHRIYDSDGKRRFIEIETLRLDDFFKDLDKRIDFIKIDVEGAEFFAFEGMLGLLDRNKRIKILMEYYPIGIKQCNKDPEECLKLLMHLGFKMYHIDSSKAKIKSAEFPEIIKMFTVEKGNFTNLFFVRE